MNRIFSISLVLNLIVAGATAQEGMKPMNDPAAFREKLIENAGKTSSVTADFIQEKHLVVLADKIVSKGVFFFRKPDQIRWEYLTPYKYLIIISNGRLFTSTDRNSKVYDIESNQMFREMNRFMSGFIQGDILKNDKDYTHEYLENDRSYYVKLVPRSEKMREMLNEIGIWFDKSDFSVTGVKMTEPGDDFTKIEFTNRKLNNEIPVEKFAF